MSDNDIESAGLTDEVKALVVNAGLVTQIKQAVHTPEPLSDNGMHALRQDAKATAEALQQLLDGGRLDDTASQKIHGVLSRLKGALQGGNISREALASALSEATSIMSAADGSGKSGGAATIEQLWQKIETYNKDIDDDFAKMRKEGIVFDENLWNEHKRLSEYLLNNPHDIQQQKALDAVDDQLVRQAETQIAEHPEATQTFNDAKKKSDDRRKAVDHALENIGKQSAAIGMDTDSEWDAHVANISSQKGNSNQPEDVTMNDVQAPPPAGPKPKLAENIYRH